MKCFIHFLEGFVMTATGGVALAVSLTLMLAHIKPMVDPAWITVFVCGVPLLYFAITRLVLQRWVSSALLICMAMVACLYIGELFAAGEVAFIMALGALLEDHTAGRARSGITKLVRLAPTSGRRIVAKGAGEEEHVETVPIGEISAGDVLRVLPGERIAVDGCIVRGCTSVDQSVMTGESLPVDKKVGDDVFCGTMNCYGSVDICATRVGKDSSLQRVVALALEAGDGKAPMQRIADRWATWLVPVALLIAIATYVITGELVRGVTVLVVFCPCALALATPVSIVAGIGQATRFGVLVKSGEALERTGSVDCIAFDKTGTLTRGVLTVCGVSSFVGDMEENSILLQAASVEALSEHPIGKAITRHALSSGMLPSEVDGFRIFAGRGVSARVEDKTVMCGKESFIMESGVRLTEKAAVELHKLSQEGKAAAVVAVDGRCVGLVSLSDELRPDAAAVVKELHGMGVDTVMLTGDNPQAAAHFSSQVGIGNVSSGLMPADKVDIVSGLRRKGRVVCMIGDGVNDAPALRASDVGVAMGSMGSDIAIDSADIALMGDDIALIPYLKRLSVAVIRSIKLNITLSMCINFVAIALSVVGILEPVSGALVHNAGSVLVVLNAALLYDRRV